MDGKVSARSLLNRTGWGIFFSRKLDFMSLFRGCLHQTLYLTTEYIIQSQQGHSKVYSRTGWEMQPSDAQIWRTQAVTHLEARQFSSTFLTNLTAHFSAYVHTRLMSQSSQISGGFSRPHVPDSACQPSMAGNMSTRLKVSLLLRCLSWGVVKIKHVPLPISSSQ